jgi:hypothetical protein
MTVVVRHGFAWVAQQDGVAHAQRARGRAVWTLCGRPAIDERFARPAVVRCERCSQVAQGVA